MEEGSNFILRHSYLKTPHKNLIFQKYDIMQILGF